MKQFDLIVVGAGIVGLATALKIKENNPKIRIAILEKEGNVALHQTSNNSGVIHSGIYYKPGSLKARNCIEGYQMLVEFCQQEGVPYELCGKIIVATDRLEQERMQQVYQRGIQNGLTDIRLIGPEEIRHYEPHCTGIAGIHVPYTGIVDYKLVAHKYAEVFEKRYGGEVFLNHPVTAISQNSGGVTVEAGGTAFQTKLIVNCGGLYSDKLAALTRKNLDIRIIPFRGEYYMLKKEREFLVKNLIYPVPDPNFPFLGVHFTRMMRGGVEAGPNAVFAFRKEGYHKTDFQLSEFIESVTWPGFQKVALKYWKTGVGEFYRSWSKSAFTKALQRLIPEVQEADLLPGGAGVRAQACDRTGGLIDDFLILHDERVINVCNAPSPAATSSLSIGKTVAEMVLKNQ